MISSTLILEPLITALPTRTFGSATIRSRHCMPRFYQRLPEAASGDKVRDALLPRRAVAPSIRRKGLGPAPRLQVPDHGVGRSRVAAVRTLVDPADVAQASSMSSRYCPTSRGTDDLGHDAIAQSRLQAIAQHEVHTPTQQVLQPQLQLHESIEGVPVEFHQQVDVAVRAGFVAGER